MQNAAIERAKEHFGTLLEKQISRVEAMKESSGFIDYNALGDYQRSASSAATVSDLQSPTRREAYLSDSSMMRSPAAGSSSATSKASLSRTVQHTCSRYRTMSSSRSKSATSL